MSKHFYFDKELGQCVEGFPPSNIKRYGEAPFIITDTIDRFYHHGSLTYVDSKSKLRDIDAACGTITTDKKLPPDPSKQREKRKERRKDLHNAIHKSVAQLEAGTAPLTEEMRADCRRQNEAMEAILGKDCFSIGKSRNGKRKRRS